MNKQIEKVISIANAEVGYKEEKTNITKYAKDFDTKYPDFYNTKKQGVAWCDMFVDWLFVTAFGEDKALKMLCQPKKSAGAGCKYSAQYYEKKSRFFSQPKAGDQIFFLVNGEINHTGLVVKVDEKKVYTVEGNSENAVKAHSYSLDNKKIAGYGRPIYDEETMADVAPTSPAKPEPVQEHPVVEVPGKSDAYYTVKKGDTLSGIAQIFGTTISTLQAINKISNPDLIYPGEKILLPPGYSQATEPIQKPTTFIGKVATNKLPLNVRSGAGTNYSVVRTLAKGSTIELFIDKKGDWYKLTDGSGFVSAKFITRA